MTPNPGSDEAIANGCTCPVLDNEHGKGSGWGEGCFWMNNACPIHGRKLTADDFRDAYELTDQTANSCDMREI